MQDIGLPTSRKRLREGYGDDPLVVAISTD